MGRDRVWGVSPSVACVYHRLYLEGLLSVYALTTVQNSLAKEFFRMTTPMESCEGMAMHFVHCSEPPPGSVAEPRPLT